ncbi:unnamed protein product [Agarophyton chilense]
MAPHTSPPPPSNRSVSVAPKSAPPPPRHRAAQYEKRHVNDVYHSIAPHFASTRHAPWPRVNHFLTSLPPFSLVADVGCGNGKYISVLQHNAPSTHHMVAVDMCAPLLHYAKQHLLHPSRSTCDLAVAHALYLPFEDASFHAALNIAVVHHFATQERRVQALRETLRILAPKGRALIYVWALERPIVIKPKRGNTSKMLNRRFDSQDVFVPWHMRHKKQGASDDRILADWHAVHQRYYHVYRQGELEHELSQVPHAHILQSYYDHQNWCVLLEKR